MSIEQTNLLNETAITGHLEDMYGVCQEIAILSSMWAEMSAGPHNANDVLACDCINKRIRALRKERSAIHKLIHEEPEHKPPQA